MVLPGAPDPRFEAVGVLIVSRPLVTANVTVVAGSPAACAAARAAGMAGPLTAADAATGASTDPATAMALSARPTECLMYPPIRPGVPGLDPMDGHPPVPDSP
jgi:hypothetical protein